MPGDQGKVFARGNGAAATAILALADGTIFRGRGFGASGAVYGELCFNTAMSGYQEVLSDPASARQIITFTFPHIGNVGTNPEDDESPVPAAIGMVLRADVTEPSNWRATEHLSDWLRRHGRIGISGIDTRRLTRTIREGGVQHAALAHDPDGRIDTDRLIEQARGFAGIGGADLAGEIASAPYRLDEMGWARNPSDSSGGTARCKVVAIEFGGPRSTLRALAAEGAEVIVMPSRSAAAEILAHDPDGIFLTSGPGDPAATGAHAVPLIQELLKAEKPIFGVGLGHQLLALALGGRSEKLAVGQHGANHPVQNVETGRVEITRMNNGFAVERGSLPESVVETHKSLFDGTNCGIRLKDRPVFSVQYQPMIGAVAEENLFARFIASTTPR